MDFQFWLYLIVGAIYFLSRILKKQESQPKNDQPSTRNVPNRPTTENSKPVTFEELLKEITEAKQPQKPVYQPFSRTESKQTEVVDYDEQIGEEEQDLEDVDYNNKKSRLYEDYEEAKRQAFVRPSLEETMNVRDTVVEFEKFKVFDREKKRNLLIEYTKDIRDPEGLKKAFVLSEILNRKF